MLSSIPRHYPADWHRGEEAYYPVNNDRNQKLYQQYAALAKNEPYTIFDGRLAEYKYYDINHFRKIALRCPAIHMYETMYSRIPDADSSSTKTELPARSHASGFSPSRSSSRFASMTLR
ncbi:MAG: UDP-galactopyranose mutase [Selenomonas bovis]